MATLSPTNGPTYGGNTVTITGSGYVVGGTTVKFGTKPATNVVVAVGGLSLTATAPSGSGTVGVTVTTAGGTTAPASYFYISPPIKSQLTSASGPTTAATTSLVGANLSTATAVTFGLLSATGADLTVVNDSLLDVNVPDAAAGTVPVSVTTGGGTTNGLFFTRIAVPTVTNINPASGSTLGGTAVTIDGTGVGDATSVTFDGTAAAFLVIDEDSVVAYPPPHAADTVDVAVTNSGGTVTETDGFTYAVPPT
jgi:hypothetical protein